MSKATIEAFRAYPRYTAENYDEVMKARKIFAKGYAAAQKELGWISVKERLPELDEEVIVLRSFVSVGGIEYDDPYLISFGHIVDTERCIDYNGWNVPGVKFWMPIPELPKEK